MVTVREAGQPSRPATLSTALTTFPSSSGGTHHRVVWDCAADFPDMADVSRRVTIRIEPSDAGGAGVAATQEVLGVEERKIGEIRIDRVAQKYAVGFAAGEGIAPPQRGDVLRYETGRIGGMAKN